MTKKDRRDMAYPSGWNLSMGAASRQSNEYGMEEDGDEIPQPSPLRTLAEQEDLQSNEVFVLVEAFMPVFREKQSKRFVKKTLSIPYWMNAEAERIGLNFSQTLQNALEEKIALAK
jgi:hicB family toxin-antitoxin system